MTATINPVKPVWQSAAESFLPDGVRARADFWLRHSPVALIIALQAVFSLRLHNSPFQDEGLYIHTGHWLLDSWTGGEPIYLKPELFFSGAPQLYPVWAALLDSVGGLTLARLFSTLCMLSSTVALYWTTNLLFPDRPGFRWRVRPGVFAALTFALSSSVIFLGNFATFDAPSFTMLTWAVALAAWSAVRGKSIWWPVLIGSLCAMAVLTKYSSAIDVPFVLLLMPVAGWKVRGLWALVRGALAGGVCLGLLTASVLTWAAPLLRGLRTTTTGRVVSFPETASKLAADVLTWEGIPLALMLAGAILLARRSPALAALLAFGTLAAPAYQIHMGESVSLNKHVVLGLLLGAPLAGLALAMLVRVRLGALVAVAVVWTAFIVAMIQSQTMFATWPDTSVLQRQIAYSIKSMPWIRIVGDIPEPLEYAFADSTKPWQWTGTYDNSFFYQGLSGVNAYRQALRDNYFQLVFLDGSYSISRELLPEMRSYGFTETSVVRTPNTNHSWHIFQRFDHLTE